MTSEKDSSAWQPHGNKNKKLRRQRWLEKKEREYIDELPKSSYRALRQAIAKKEEGIKPDDVPLSWWENMQQRGYSWVGKMRNLGRVKK